MPQKHLIPACLGLALTAAFGQPDSLVWGDFKPGIQVDAGHIFNGRDGNTDLTFQTLNRNTVVLSQSATYGRHWEFAAGLEGIMWWPFVPGGLEPYQRTVRVEPRLSEARARLRLNTENTAFVEAGFFPYKYNPDAQNLGEYLYRSGTYPGLLKTTDGFHLMNRASFDAFGAHARYSMLNGIVRHDVNLFGEPTTSPTGDLTPAYEITVTLPLLEIGAGAAYNRLISFNSAKVTPHVPQNGYFAVDTGGAPGPEFTGSYGAAPSYARNRIELGDSTVTALHYYTQRGVKLMARAALDLGFLLPEDHRNSGDLRIFAEAALLGVEDQPYYYDDKARRIPVMVGVNVPTLKVLDLLSVQTEYYAARYSNAKQFIYYGRPIWGGEDFDPTLHSRDDWKWSVYARRRINRLLTLHAQVANDHMRLPSFNTNLTDEALTQNPKQGYYLVRLECSL